MFGQYPKLLFDELLCPQRINGNTEWNTENQPASLYNAFYIVDDQQMFLDSLMIEQFMTCGTWIRGSAQSNSRLQDHTWDMRGFSLPFLTT